MSLKGSAVPDQILVGRINRLNLLTISAYGIAVKNGFEGTEEEWLESLKMSSKEVEDAVIKYLTENPVAIDSTLTISGQGADAKATGDAINSLNSKVKSHTDSEENPHGVTKAQVGLGNVDNTSDANKPVSTAQAQAIADAKKAGTDAQAMAQTVRQTAENAQTSANNAQTSANNAQTSADNAQATANRALVSAVSTTLTASGWSSSAPYTQTVTISGLTDAKRADVKPVYSGDLDADLAMAEACAMVSYATKSGSAMTFRCLEEKPEVDIPIEVEVYE